MCEIIIEMASASVMLINDYNTHFLKIYHTSSLVRELVQAKAR
jgi:hypothetical protein